MTEAERRELTREELSEEIVELVKSLMAENDSSANSREYYLIVETDIEDLLQDDYIMTLSNDKQDEEDKATVSFEYFWSNEDSRGDSDEDPYDFRHWNMSFYFSNGQVVKEGSSDIIPNLEFTADVEVLKLSGPFVRRSPEVTVEDLMRIRTLLQNPGRNPLTLADLPQIPDSSWIKLGS